MFARFATIARSLSVLPILLLPQVVSAQNSGAVGAATQEAPFESTSSYLMAEAAAAFLSSLEQDKREAVVSSLDSTERGEWSNLPTFFHERPGLSIGEMTTNQRMLLHELLRASLSSQGYQKVAGIMRVDEFSIVYAPVSDRDWLPTTSARNYFVTVFGDPSSGDDWAWLLQGHHLAAHFTSSMGKVGFTPLFLGAEPNVLPTGLYAGWSPLAHDVRWGFELMASLTPEQRAVALIDEDGPPDLLEGVGDRASLQRFEGLKASDMSESQRALMRLLVDEYVHNAYFDAAAGQLAAISDAGWENLYFSWRGEFGEIGTDAYWRVHGPRILIEFDQQDRENHVHMIVRDPINDYGEDWLRTHYEESHTAQQRVDATRAGE